MTIVDFNLRRSGRVSEYYPPRFEVLFPLEKLHGAFMLFSLFPRVEGPKVATLSRFRVLLHGIETIFA